MDELRRDWDLLRRALGLMVLGIGLTLLITIGLICHALWLGGTVLARWTGLKT